MKKRAHSALAGVAVAVADSCNNAASPSSPSSSSSSSSSSSCVVDCHNNISQDHTHQVNEKPPKINIKPPKRAKKRKSINGMSNDKDKPPNAVNPPTNRRSSIYRGVTRHRWTGRFEAHLWDKSSWNNIQNKKGRQVYLGAYDSELDAARTYDLAALKYWGPETTLNFPVKNYTKELEEMQNASKEEYLASLRRRSSGFSRGVSKYRGVARHHHNGRWEARIGRVFGNKYLYLGTFSSQEEAAAAYDLAAIEYRGTNAVTNFDISNYYGRAKNLVPKSEPPPSPVERKAMQLPEQNQLQPIKQQIEEEEQKDHVVKPQDSQQYDPNAMPSQLDKRFKLTSSIDQNSMLEEVKPRGLRQDEQITIPSQFDKKSKLTSSIDHNSMLEMDGPEDDRENPWNFCLDMGSYDPHLVLDVPLDEDGKRLDLFDQTSFEDNIDMIFDLDAPYIDDIDNNTVCKSADVDVSRDLDKEAEILPKMENLLSFYSASSSLPSSTSSLLSCQL